MPSLPGCTMFAFLPILFLIPNLRPCRSLNNGLARTPPMGFNTWQRFRCNIDCDNEPDMCISEKLYTSMADAMIERGLRDAGYIYVNIDDCWMERARDSATGRLVADRFRFPHGIKYLSDYMHERGMKLGLYQDIGKYTCIGFNGVEGFEQIDAETFADWEIDYIKMDGCFQNPKRFDQTYPKMGLLLNQTKRPMVYSCSWPYYQYDKGIQPDYSRMAKYCNMWRNYNDIQDHYGPGRGSILDIVDWFGDHVAEISKFHGPGIWNDPDMMIVGDYGLSYDQAKAHFALWAILAAPMLVSADLRTMNDDFVQILLNKDIIAVDQDELGIMGDRLESFFREHTDGIEIWSRKITPTYLNEKNIRMYSKAVVFWNRRYDGAPSKVARSLSSLNLRDAGGYYVKDLYSGESYGIMHSYDMIKVEVNPSGGVVMLRFRLVNAGAQPDDDSRPSVKKSRIRISESQFERFLSLEFWLFILFVIAFLVILPATRRFILKNLLRMKKVFR